MMARMVVVDLREKISRSQAKRREKRRKRKQQRKQGKVNKVIMKGFPSKMSESEVQRRVRESLRCKKVCLHWYEKGWCCRVDLPWYIAPDWAARKLCDLCEQTYVLNTDRTYIKDDFEPALKEMQDMFEDLCTM